MGDGVVLFLWEKIFAKNFFLCEIIVQYCNKEERWDNFLIVQTEFTLDLNPYPSDLK